MGRKKTRAETKGLPYHFVDGLGYYVKTTLTIDGEKRSISKRWFKTAKEAKDWYETEVDRLLGDSGNGDPLWDEVKDSFLASKESSVSYGTRSCWKYRFKNYFAPYCSGKRISEAYSNGTIMLFYSKLKGDAIGNSTKNAIVSLYQELLEYAYNTTDLPEKRYKAGRSIVQRFKENPLDRKERATFTDDEMKAFQEAWPKGSKNWVLVQAICNLGLRANELLALSPEDFNFEEGCVRIHRQMQYRDGKYTRVGQLKSGNSYRDMYFGKEFGETMKNYFLDLGLKGDCRVFPLSQSSFNRFVKRTLRKAGLGGKYSNHSARHYLDTVLSQYCKTDRDRIAKAKMMGHDPAIDINTYSTHNTEEAAKSIVSKA